MYGGMLICSPGPIVDADLPERSEEVFMSNYGVFLRVSTVFLGFLLLPATLSAGTIFHPTRVYNSGGQWTFSVAVADVNGDGKLDLITASQCFVGTLCSYNEGDDGAVGVSLGRGDGTFRAPQTYYSGGGTAYSVVVGDVNGDGKPDILVTNACVGVNNCTRGAVAVLLGNGDGTFQSAWSYSSGGYQPFAIAVGDVNGDGILDIFVGNNCALTGCGQSVVGLLIGNRDGTFQNPVSIDPAGFDPQSMVVADVNGDGKADLLIVNSATSADDWTGKVSVLLGRGEGTFLPARTYSSGGYMGSSLFVADANNDGMLDLIVASLETSSEDHTHGVIGVLFGNGDGTFQTAQMYRSGAFDTDGVNFADVDGDGIPDMVTSSACYSNDSGSDCGKGGVVSVLRGNGDGTFREALLSSSGGIHSKSLAVADLNHDGRSDAVVASVCLTSKCDGGAVGVLLNGKGPDYCPATGCRHLQ
jgi:large repetitive protein